MEKKKLLAKKMIILKQSHIFFCIILRLDD